MVNVLWDQYKHLGLKGALDYMKDMHLGAGRTRHGFSVIKSQSKDIINAIKSGKKSNELRKIVGDFLKIVESHLKNSYVVIRDGAKLFYFLHEEIKEKEMEDKMLVEHVQIPRGDGVKIFNDFAEAEQHLRSDVKKVQKAYLGVKRGNVIVPGLVLIYRAEPRARHKIYKMEDLYKHIKEIEQKLKRDESMHAIDLVKKDFEVIAEDIGDESELLRMSLVFTAKDMQKVHEILENIKKEANRLKDVAVKNQIIATVERIIKEWEQYAGIEANLFTRLRFGGGMAEEMKAAA